VFGATYLLIAYSLHSTQLTPASRYAFRFALGIMPLTGWALLWLACGTIALADAILTRGRDALGFAAAVLAPLAWGVVYFAAWIQGTPRLWETALLYGLIAAAVLIVAGMPDPSTVRKVLRATEPRR
jgi:hypothetical protein